MRDTQGAVRYGLLDREDLPGLLKTLNQDNLDELCGEIRQFLLDSVSRTGGHLASNLGAVELTVALHRCFDTATDRLIFDVGHQCYTHKLLTGRREGFARLRQYGGLSGFLKPEESVHDPCITGHASSSVSVALGMAIARTMQGESYQVVAVVGDGALGGGMVYEAMNAAGASHEPLIIVLNDNNMSIDCNVGAMSRHLANLRVRPGYLQMKKDVRSAFSKIPGGSSFNEAVSKTKRAMRHAVVPGSLFEQMGLSYLGPVDGHDILAMCQAFEAAKKLQGPVLVHVMTKKGKGYSFAEEHPEKFHGVSAFDVETGETWKKFPPSFSAQFGRCMQELAEQYDALCAVTAAMPSGTGLTGFRDKYPRRFFDVGIAEEHAVAMSAGMAKQGLRPVCALYSTFLQRGFDQCIHDAAIDRVPIILAIDRAGIVGADGPTHNGVFDVGFLRQIPGMTLLAPSSFAELRTMLRQAVEHTDGPIALRYPRGGEGVYKGDNAGRAGIFLREGTDVVLVSYGILINQALRAAELLEEQGVSAAVYKLNELTAPIPQELLEQIRICRAVVVAEDVVHNGGMGQAIAEELGCRGIETDYLTLLNTGESFAPQGTVEQIYQYYHIDAAGIARACLEARGGGSV